MKKITAVALMIVVLCGLIALGGCIDPKPSDRYSIHDEFVDNEVVIRLTNEESRLLKEYTPNDFDYVGCIKIIEWTKSKTEYLKGLLAGEPEDEKKHVDIETFHRTFTIYLDKHGKRNVLKAIDLLESRNEIELATPNFIISLCSQDFDTEQPVNDEQWGIEQINTYSAWELTSGNKNIVVGVLDSGIDASHE